MERTTISFRKGTIKRLKKIAAERGISMSELLRQAVDEIEAQNRPKPHLGIFDSGYTDTSELASNGPFPPRSWR